MRTAAPVTAPCPASRAPDGRSNGAASSHGGSDRNSDPGSHPTPARSARSSVAPRGSNTPTMSASTAGASSSQVAWSTLNTSPPSSARSATASSAARRPSLRSTGSWGWSGGRSAEITSPPIDLLAHPPGDEVDRVVAAPVQRPVLDQAATAAEHGLVVIAHPAPRLAGQDVVHAAADEALRLPQAVTREEGAARVDDPALSVEDRDRGPLDCGSDAVGDVRRVDQTHPSRWRVRHRGLPPAPGPCPAAAAFSHRSSQGEHGPKDESLAQDRRLALMSTGVR